MTDFHTASLDQKDYLDQQVLLTPATCWDHDGFMDYYRSVCSSATEQAASPYGGPDYDGAFDDGTPLEMILEAFRTGDSAAETADALLQGEAEAEVDAIVKEGGMF